MSIKTKRITSIVISAATLIVLSTAIFASRSFSGKQIVGAAVAPESPMGRSAPNSPQKRTTLLETELITATPRGFEPGSITRSEGKFILMVENPNREELDLRLTRETGAPVHHVHASREEPEWNEIQDLQPGLYVLTEKKHPEWACLIRITAR